MIQTRFSQTSEIAFLPTLADLFETSYLVNRGARGAPGGVDFSSIRVHYVGADRACRCVRASAFTVGSDIYFADGAFAPHTRAGLWLLAHEVAHVVQQPASTTAIPRPLSRLYVTPAGTSEERTADAAANAFITGRPFAFAATKAPLTAGPPLAAQRYMAWEHSLLGDGQIDHASSYCDLLERLGRDPRRVDEERLRAEYPGLETVRLPGSGLVVTLGELNILPDYLGDPEEIETAPLAFIGPLIQSLRSWSIAELRPAAERRSGHPRLPGSLRYPRVGGLAEIAEVASVDLLGRRCGFAPSSRYSSVLARNAGHFVPFSWYRWLSFHLRARELIERSASAAGAERDTLRRRARICACYADHFLQDSFAAGHQINKTLVMQWYIEWLAEAGVSFPHRDVLMDMTVARQPLVHGPGHYDRASVRPGDAATGRTGGVPRPPWDPQDVAAAATIEDRIAVSGLSGHGDGELRAAYAAYLTMLGSGTVQFATKVVHDYLNDRSLVVSSGPVGPSFRLHGDRTLLAGGDGTLRAAQAAAASRRAISELLRHGETDVDSWEIFAGFPDHVEHSGRLGTLQEWHRTGLRDLCFGKLFGRWSTRAIRRVMSTAFRQLATITADGEPP
jgi:Domain of unknown function (DUF4157)